MKIEILPQPFSADARLGEVLSARVPTARAVWFLVAWAQVSGLSHIVEALEILRRSGGRSSLLLGIDGGIATADGLRLALRSFDEVHVFHDPSGRTYHPKLYVIENDESVVVVAGSSNLTEGGLYRNYELNVVTELDRQSPADMGIFHTIEEFKRALYNSESHCRPLDERLIAELSALTVLGGEEVINREREAIVERSRRLSAALFGPTTEEFPRIPRRPRVADVLTPTWGLDRNASASPRAALNRSASVRWWKRLTKSDAMRKKATSHQRKYVILGKAGHDVDQKTWFRDVFFRGVSWTPKQMRTGNVKEIAAVTFDVFVEEAFIGAYRLTIDHSTQRVADQNNSPTWLNWSSLSDVINERDFESWYLLLERIGDGFRLRLLRDPPE